MKTARWVQCSQRAAVIGCLVALFAPPSQAQTRSYNPIHRTAGSQELPAPSTEEISPQPATGQLGHGKHPALSGPPGQWRSIRQPGPMPLPAHQYIPSHNASQPTPANEPATPEGMPEGVANGPWQDGSPWPQAEGAGPHYGGGCGDGCCSDGCCGDCNACCGSRGFGLCGGNCGGCGSCIGHWWPRSWEVFGGVHGFKGPPDQGRNGNFGFHEGFNVGGMLKPACGIGYQIGGQFVHSNLSGDTVLGARTDSRDQTFFTVGLFRKAPRCGLQGGVVWDILHDDYYVDMTLSQLRGELSFVGPHANEVGFWFAASLDDDNDFTVQGTEEIWEPTDLYAFFFRHQFGCGGQFRVWAGFTGESDGLLGGEMFAPLSDCWGMTANIAYLIPDENGVQAIPEESWAMGINLVWYPGATARCPMPARPLFNVADNATFMVDRRQGL